MGRPHVYATFVTSNQDLSDQRIKEILEKAANAVSQSFANSSSAAQGVAAASSSSQVRERLRNQAAANNRQEKTREVARKLLAEKAHAPADTTTSNGTN